MEKKENYLKILKIYDQLFLNQIVMFMKMKKVLRYTLMKFHQNRK